MKFSNQEVLFVLVMLITCVCVISVDAEERELLSLEQICEVDHAAKLDEAIGIIDTINGDMMNYLKLYNLTEDEDARKKYNDHLSALNSYRTRVLITIYRIVVCQRVNKKLLDEELEEYEE